MCCGDPELTQSFDQRSKSTTSKEYLQTQKKLLNVGWATNFYEAEFCISATPPCWGPKLMWSAAAGLASSRPSPPYWPAERGKGVASDDCQLGGGAHLGCSTLQAQRGWEGDSGWNVWPEVDRPGTTAVPCDHPATGESRGGGRMTVVLLVVVSAFMFFLQNLNWTNWADAA